MATRLHVPRPAFAGRRSLAWGALAVVLIVGVVWALDGGRADELDSATTAVTLTGFRNSLAPRIGQPAPDFSLQSPDGQAVALDDLRGQPVLINFWASWCPPCRTEMPDLETLANEYREAGVIVLAVNVQEEAGVARRFGEALRLTLPLLLDGDGAVAARYGLTALPTSYFVDRTGIVRDQHTGALTLRGLRNKVAKLLSY